MSRPSTPWSVLSPAVLGIVACAACCALPFAATALGAGAATALTALVEPVAAALLAGGFVIAGVAWVQRRREPGCGQAACAVDGSCGCGATSDLPPA